jgi:hypothetical protein
MLRKEISQYGRRRNGVVRGSEVALAAARRSKNLVVNLNSIVKRGQHNKK